MQKKKKTAIKIEKYCELVVSSRFFSSSVEFSDAAWKFMTRILSSLLR